MTKKCVSGHIATQYSHTSFKVSSKVGQIYSEMIFVQGYIHCDPHPGNILIRKNSRGVVEIVLLDHGLYHVSGVHVKSLTCNDVLAGIPEHTILF